MAGLRTCGSTVDSDGGGAEEADFFPPPAEPPCRFRELLASLAESHEQEVCALKGRIAQLEVKQNSHARLSPARTMSSNVDLQSATSQLSATSKAASDDSTSEFCTIRRHGQVSLTDARPWNSRSVQVTQPIVPLRTGVRTLRNSKVGVRMLGNIVLDKTRTERFVSAIDIVTGGIIILNVVSLFASFELKGREVGRKIGVELAGGSWEEHAGFFETVDHAFQIVYLAELLVRLAVLRKRFFVTTYRNTTWRLEKFNLFDILVVLLGSVDLYVLPSVDSDGSWFFARVVRIARVSRTLKLVRLVKVFSQLRVLTSTIMSSFLALFWSMVLLFLLMSLGAICILQLVQSELQNAQLDEATRTWMYESYGTAFKSLWSMFELTLGSQGTVLVRPLVRVHWQYTVFFVLYISAVGFAVICIIESLFLKETLRAAGRDADMAVRERLDCKRETFKRIHELFIVADESGDGLISIEEFENFFNIPTVKGFLDTLEVQTEEAAALFDLLDPGTGRIAYEDFVSGIFKLKGQARSMDVIAIMLDCRKLIEMCDGIQQQFHAMQQQMQHPTSANVKCAEMHQPDLGTTRPCQRFCRTKEEHSEAWDAAGDKEDAHAAPRAADGHLDKQEEACDREEYQICKC